MEAPVIGAVGLAALGYMSYKTALQRTVDEAVALTSKLPSIQSVPVNEHENPVGETPIRRSVFTDGALVDKSFPEVNTLYDNFMRGVRLYPKRHCLGEREVDANGKAGQYRWQTYAEVGKRLTAFGSGLLELTGLPTGSFVGIYSINRPEWVIVEQACNAYSLVPIPLYDTLGASAVEYIINQAEIPVACCEPKVLELLLSSAPNCPSLRVVVLFGEPSASDRAHAQKSGVQLVSMAEVEASGRKPSVTREHIPPSPDSLATICYTSGTTGNPKGAMLSHRNMVANVAALNVQVPDMLQPTDVHISYLPLAHVFERLVTTGLYGHGAAVGFYQGDVLTLVDDIAALRPTIFPSVPRLLNRLYDRITGTIEAAGGLKTALFRKGYAAKQENLRKYSAVVHPFWDRLVFGKIRDRLGGRVRMIFTGSAPIAPHVLEFLRICFCCHVFEGYGQTEATACVTATLKGDTTVGHVGPPVPCVEVKLVDVPEMKYLSTDSPCPRGEVCVRGPSIFTGYYKDEEKTRETLDEDGWLHSGDIGVWLPNGTLKIVDRKKNIFKLAQGEYVAPEKIENIAAQSKFVAQSFVYGDSLRAYVVAVVVPDPEVADEWKAEHGLASSSLAELCRNEQFVSAVLQDIQHTLKEAQCKGFELPRSILLESEPFSVDNNLLTPTFKLKRILCREKYEAALNDLYENPPKLSSKL